MVFAKILVPGDPLITEFKNAQSLYVKCKGFHLSPRVPSSICQVVWIPDRNTVLAIAALYIQGRMTQRKVCMCLGTAYIRIFSVCSWLTSNILSQIFSVFKYSL